MVRTALVCVRTPLAAQSIAACASRLGVTTIRTAVSEAEVMARLGDAPAELILADTAITKPDTVGFTKRVLALAPQATLVLLGHEEPQVASAAVSAGARGLIRGGDNDLAGTVAKTLLLIGSPRRPHPAAPGGRRTDLGGADGPLAAAAGSISSPPAAGGDAAIGRAAGNGAPAGHPPAAEHPAAAGHAPPGSSGTAARADSSANASANPGANAGANTGTGAGAPGAAGRSAPAGSQPQPADRPGGAAATQQHPDTDPGAAGTALVPSQREDAPDGSDARRIPLTERELQVLRGMAEGKSNAEIGRDLFVSEDTVKTHARRLFRKLRARDRAHAVAVGFRAGALR